MQALRSDALEGARPTPPQEPQGRDLSAEVSKPGQQGINEEAIAPAGHWTSAISVWETSMDLSCESDGRMVHTLVMRRVAVRREGGGGASLFRKAGLNFGSLTRIGRQ